MKADEEAWELVPGMLVRVDAGQKRKVLPGDDGVTILAIGNTPGKAYEPRR